LAFAFLDQPETADVFEEPNAVAETDFVGKIELPGEVVDDGVNQLDAH